MPVSPNFNIPYPDGASGLTPLASWFAGIAVGVDQALMTGIGGAPRLANSDAERLAIFPTPAQGNSVLRPDRGWVEQYFAAYNGTTNPAGATPAGWYPASGATPLLIASRGNFSVPSPTSTNILGSGTVVGKITPLLSLSAAGVITVQQPGVYEIYQRINQVEVNANGQRNVLFGTTGTTLGSQQGTFLSQSGVANGSYLSTGYAQITAAGQTITPVMVQNSGITLNFTTVVSVKYLGPGQ